MKLKDRLLRESQRHSLFMLACIFAEILSVCGFLTGLQDQNGTVTAGFALFSLALALGAVYHGSEAWRHLGLFFNEIEYKRDEI